jgi:hypothetical protein
MGRCCSPEPLHGSGGYLTGPDSWQAAISDLSRGLLSGAVRSIRRLILVTANRYSVNAGSMAAERLLLRRRRYLWSPEVDVHAPLVDRPMLSLSGTGRGELTVYHAQGKRRRSARPALSIGLEVQSGQASQPPLETCVSSLTKVPAGRVAKTAAVGS